MEGRRWSPTSLWLSRRAVVLGLVAAAGSGTYLLLARPAARITRAAASLRTMLEGVAKPVPPVGAVGPLDGPTLVVLRLTVETLLSVPTEIAPYERLLEWRARNVPGHLRLYREFAAAVDRAAHELEQRTFVSAASETRRAIVREIGRFGSRALPPTKLWRGLAHRQMVLYANEVIRPILTLFAQTHAIELAGFGKWPGLPRGLEDYRTWPRPGRGGRP